MVRTRNSSRGRRKKRSTHVTNASRSKKTSKSNGKTPSKVQSPYCSSSDTSPFKGYEECNNEQTDQPRLFGSLLSDRLETKDSVFDRLVNEDLPSNLHRNIRTYTNKKKDKQCSEHNLLEFEDCKNREVILQWLNDNRNVFDRITQTQTDCDDSTTDTQVTLDMPSVSQQNTKKLNRSSRDTKKILRSPYKLRARSLNIQIKKNSQKGRNRSHSLAGDTPVLENYYIEDVVTDEDVPVPAKEDVIIVDLMEDEYLDNIEREVMQNEEKKNHSLTGWDRIKDINKTINSAKKQPKQLKIMLQSNEHKKNDNLVNNNVSCYDYDALENYFIENMEKLLQDEKHRSNSSTVSKTSTGGRLLLKNAVEIGKNFLAVLKEVVDSEGRECLKELQPMISKIKTFCDVSLKDSAIQTYSKQTFDKNVQTEKNSVNVAAQTERNFIHSSVQTERNFIHAGVQTEDSRNDLNIAQQNVDIIELQPKGVQDLKEKLCRQASTVTSATPSDIFEDDRERLEVQEAFAVDMQSEGDSHSVEIVEPKDEVFDDDFNFEFNTDDLLKNEVQSVKDEDKQTERSNTQGSVLLVSTEIQLENKGVKRQCDDRVDSEDYPPKRPCAKFINDDLSVAFSSCMEHEDNTDGKQTDIDRQSLQDSNDAICDEQLVKLFEKHERSLAGNSKIESIARPQEHTNELENVINNGVKSCRPVENEKNLKFHESPSKLEDDLDYFKPASYTANTEKTPIRRDLFNSKNNGSKASPNVFSESLFGNDVNITVLANRTYTQHYVDMIKDYGTAGDGIPHKEEQAISKDRQVKINILENVIVKKGTTVGTKTDDCMSESSDVLSDVDVVETTPQKKRFPDDTQERDEHVLDITLPPPLEFQDSEEANLECNTSKVFDSQQISRYRRPLAVINKITSTPITQKRDSENFLSLSPISCHGRKPQLSPVNTKSTVAKKSESNRENCKNPGPFEFAQQQLSKFSPLVIAVKQSQDFARVNSTPKQKSILNYVRPSQESQKSQSFELSGKRKPCIACSRVSRDQVIAISTLTNKKLASYSTSFSPKVTHLIVSTNERNCLKDHTIKFVSAVAAGIWVLNFEWVQECLAKNAIVPEEPFEVLDVSGAPGPRQARLTRNTNPLFRGYKIHAAAPFASTTQQEVENVIRSLGGKVVPSPEHFLDENGYICVIVTEARATQDFELYETWLEALKVVTVDIEWLSRSVGQYKLLSLRPFTLCSDDGIEELGYPPELTVSMTYSFSQQTFSSVPSSK